MSTEPFIGEIKIFGFDFAPRGYSSCAGQLLPIASYTALFSLLGTTYGGNGVQTFALPDLRGRMPINQGQGPGLPFYPMGQYSGNTQVTLTNANLPAHIHTLNSALAQINVDSGTADELNPGGNHLAATNSPIYSGNGGSPNAFLAGGRVGGTTDITGSNIPVNISNPFLVVNYSIATVGIFPSRP